MFENATIESKRKPRSLKRLLVLPVSIALHGCAIAALTFATVWTVDMPAATPVQYGVVFVSDPLPPPPPPPLGNPPTSPPSEADAEPPSPPDLTPPRDTMVPETIPNEPPKTNTAGRGDVVGEATGQGESWSVPGGDPEGESGGTVGGVSIPGREPELPTGPVPVSADMKAPVLLHRVEPVYPRIAILSGLEGTVSVECIIDRTGQVRDARVMDSRSDLLSKAAVDAVLQWRYSPATLNGRPLDVILHLRVVFDLDRVR